MENKSLKLKRNETFSIREGWLEKGINIVHNNSDCFRGDDSPIIFGLGSNMCKSLKYWLEAGNIIKYSSQKGSTLTEFGEILLKYDQYLEDNFSLWFIHTMLASNFEDCPVISLFFNSGIKRFTKESLKDLMLDEFSKEYDKVNEKSLESDINVLVRTYYSEDNSNPENNMDSPFRKLGLIINLEKRMYEKYSPSFNDLDYRVVYYAMQECFAKNEFNLEDLYTIRNNPIYLYNLTKSAFLKYLDEMKKNNLINIVKTAGLNTVSIKKRLSVEELFESYFGRE